MKVKYDTSKPVMVTGATGYIASWLIKMLLDEGLTVHGTVRNLNSDRVKKLLNLVSKTKGTLKLFKADLLDEGSYKDAMLGCSVVFHIASPFKLNVKNPQKDLVNPAVNGTKNVLNTVNQTNSVLRVVLTSSTESMVGNIADIAKAPNQTLTEDIWNISSSLSHKPYSFSKVEAEKTAWEMATGQDRYRLVVINPSLVIGPSIIDPGSSESFNVMKKFVNGTFKFGVPHYEISLVDVRNVALAHMRAGFLANAKGRHILSYKTVSLFKFSEMLRSHFGAKYPLPKRVLPKWLIWLIGPFINKTYTRKFISLNVGHTRKDDNHKSKKCLGIKYLPLDIAAAEMLTQIDQAGLLRKNFSLQE